MRCYIAAAAGAGPQASAAACTDACRACVCAWLEAGRAQEQERRQAPCCTVPPRRHHPAAHLPLPHTLMHGTLQFTSPAALSGCREQAARRKGGVWACPLRCALPAHATLRGCTPTRCSRAHAPGGRTQAQGEQQQQRRQVLGGLLPLHAASPAAPGATRRPAQISRDVPDVLAYRVVVEVLMATMLRVRTRQRLWAEGCCCTVLAQQRRTVLGCARCVCALHFARHLCFRKG